MAKGLGTLAAIREHMLSGAGDPGEQGAEDAPANPDPRPRPQMPQPAAPAAEMPPREANPIEMVDADDPANPEREADGPDPDDARYYPPGYDAEDPRTWAVPHKYRTWQDVDNARRASGEEAKRIREEAIKERAKREALEELMGKSSGTRPEAPREPPVDYASLLAEHGLAPEAEPVLRRMFHEIAQETVAASLKPVFAYGEAEARMNREFKDEWSEGKAALADMLEANPDLNAEYQSIIRANPDNTYLAMKYVLNAMKAQQNGQAPAAPPPRTMPPTPEAQRVMAARSHASLPREANPDLRAKRDVDNVKALQKLIERAHETGRQADYQAYAKARLKGLPSLYGQQTIRERTGQ